MLRKHFSCYFQAYVWRNNVYIKTSPTSPPQQVTVNGLDNEILNGIPDWVYEGELEGSRWSIARQSNASRILPKVIALSPSSRGDVLVWSGLLVVARWEVPRLHRVQRHPGAPHRVHLVWRRAVPRHRYHSLSEGASPTHAQLGR